MSAVRRRWAEIEAKHRGLDDLDIDGVAGDSTIDPDDALDLARWSAEKLIQDRVDGQQVSLREVDRLLAAFNRLDAALSRRSLDDDDSVRLPRSWERA